MKYIEFAENERLSTIVLRMMRISHMGEDEVEV
ncbi:glutamyl-tRNA amidotransferase [Streptococcus thermophilus]|nr:glutamyl-tRNA amidotransferase [Streptococcus thermophilus]MDA3674231.1 glutamyl-tRNA amidotransferase [Streptococcus thermophilus]